MKYSWLVVLVIINAQAMEQRAEQVLQQIDTAYTQFMDKDFPDPQSNVASLIKLNRALIEGIKNSILVQIVVKRADTTELLPSLKQIDARYTELQKSLIALRMIDSYETGRLFNKLHKLFSWWGDVFGFMYCAGACKQYCEGNFKFAALSACGVGVCFATSFYCKKQRLKPKQPIPTIKQIYEREPLIDNEKALELDLKSLQLKSGHRFRSVEALNIVHKLFAESSAPAHLKAEQKEKQFKLLRKARKLAFAERDIDAILSLSQQIEQKTQ